MNQRPKQQHPVKDEELPQAIFIINKHAKAAPQPKTLYQMKQMAIQKMLKEGKAKKLGLHFSNNPKNARQQSDVIIQCGNYIFHLPPSKEDIKKLPHLGKRADDKRNPKTYMSLSKAKAIIYNYIGPVEKPKERKGYGLNSQNRHKTKPKSTSTIFTSSFLGRDFY
ncbi:YkyB family protein [Bacillus testis]|uniref:YkyB family protein n=1 Tax=Bacillus testis TaxID=1622072 RepID=UPI00067E80D6|nr:YkyB family protein [Bacillus testis]